MNGRGSRHRDRRRRSPVLASDTLGVGRTAPRRNRGDMRAPRTEGGQPGQRGVQARPTDADIYDPGVALFVDGHAHLEEQEEVRPELALHDHCITPCLTA